MLSAESCRSVRVPLLLHPYFATGVMVASLFLVNGALERLELPPAARLALGMAPVAASAYLVWTMARWIRGMDELQRKIMAEALSLAYTLALLLAAALNQVHRAGFRVPLGWEDGVAILVALYACCYALTNRRYQ